VNDLLTKATMFNDTFIALYIHDNTRIPSTSHFLRPNCSTGNILFPMSLVLDQLTKLKPSKTTTPDGFSAYTIQIFGHSIARPYYFYLSISLHISLFHKLGNIHTSIPCTRKVLVPIPPIFDLLL